MDLKTSPLQTEVNKTACIYKTAGLREVHRKEATRNQLVYNNGDLK